MIWFLRESKKMTREETMEWKREGLNDIARKCEQVANNRFSLEDAEWNLLLLFRDKLDKHMEKKYRGVK